MINTKSFYFLNQIVFEQSSGSAFINTRHMYKIENMNWKEENNKLVKEFDLGNFVKAVDFVNKITPLAENADHHPDIMIHSYKKVTIQLTTHSEGQITDKDYDLAKKIDLLF